MTKIWKINNENGANYFVILSETNYMDEILNDVVKITLNEIDHIKILENNDFLKIECYKEDKEFFLSKIIDEFEAEYWHQIIKKLEYEEPVNAQLTPTLTITYNQIIWKIDTTPALPFFEKKVKLYRPTKEDKKYINEYLNQYGISLNFVNYIMIIDNFINIQVTLRTQNEKEMKFTETQNYEYLSLYKRFREGCDSKSIQTLTIYCTSSY